ncbi:UDP-N-acetylglucosamine 1-carboxyvinyltransferase [hydrothermal vent metagenome]|uniref:UDP-N-acetylglucosamine 1-carboxyvinyltransferase n=1 Tax=hydrothermal vent metagenome TaxID=652676 RepID=A0A3B1DD01_9ZZZZ
MEMFVVQGGSPLHGSVRVSGAKNSALPIMAATLMSTGISQLHGIPHLVDVRTLSKLLCSLGMKIERNENDCLQCEVVSEHSTKAEYELVRQMRASICVLGPLLAKRGRAIVSLPGGCHIGHRPVDLHLKGLQALGANITIQQGYIVAEAKQLKGTAINLTGPLGSSVTGTCNIMAAATLAKGCTTITGAACEPEVVDLGCFLNKMGANILGLGSAEIVIEGVEHLTEAEQTIIPDRIEAATLLIAAAITGGSIQLNHVRPDHMKAVIATLSEMGFQIECSENSISIQSHGKPLSISCTTKSYPGFPTDVQAQLMALLSLAEGTSRMTETVFPDRFMHVQELVRLGANIERQGASAIVSGVKKLNGAHVMASDLRASAALVIAALAAEGETVIRRIYHLDRGYEHLEKKLTQLGAVIERLQDEQ